MSIKLIVIPWFELLIDALWKNKSQMMKNENFDFPDYGGLPKNISNKLTSEHVDFLQEHLINLLSSHKTKKQFAKELAEKLTSGIVSVK